MVVTGKVTKTEVSGDFKTLHIEFADGNKITFKVTANPPSGHEIDTGDVVDVHFRPQDGAKAGVARHPKN
jgi:translation initiation factor IF-1